VDTKRQQIGASDRSGAPTSPSGNAGPGCFAGTAGREVPVAMKVQAAYWTLSEGEVRALEGHFPIGTGIKCKAGDLFMAVVLRDAPPDALKLLKRSVADLMAESAGRPAVPKLSKLRVPGHRG
jgi:hypothetical protein